MEGTRLGDDTVLAETASTAFVGACEHRCGAQLDVLAEVAVLVMRDFAVFLLVLGAVPRPPTANTPNAPRAQVSFKEEEVGLINKLSFLR